MASNDSQWLSEVHSAVSTNGTAQPNGFTHHITRFHFTFKEDDSSSELEEDNDGDLVVCRKESKTIKIEHTLGTSIEHVGLQIWPGCLLLCDYLLANRDFFTGKSVLELGGGIGLASILCSTLGTKDITCTDVGDEILDLCKHNTRLNRCTNIDVATLDWFCPGEFVGQVADVQVIIASDVIYDNEMTEAFFNVVHTLMRSSPKVLILTLEQRINFLTDGLRCACPAYEYFLEAIEELKERGKKAGMSYVVQKLDVTFDQCSKYERSDLCEIWHISNTSMENYKLKERLGKGAQGSVYLVEHRDTGVLYVLKKASTTVECNDESDANKAFQEALALQQLQHPYICVYKEFFVTWDKEVKNGFHFLSNFINVILQTFKNSAMFVCIVMDYYKNGDLSVILKQKRNQQDPIEALLLKKWIGQLIEALMFVHKHKVIHRDLKPSNIFMQEDLSLSIGDFGVSTIMLDVRTKTRTAVGSMNWMAPEVLDQPYDERSDVWSAGCVILELASCSFCDTKGMMGLLFEIKHSVTALEEILSKVTELYCPELSEAICQMLRLDFKERPCTSELAKMPFIQECLELSDAVLLAKRKRPQSAAYRPLSGGKGVAHVVNYLIDCLGDEKCVRNAMTEMVTMTADEGITMATEGKEVIAKVIKDYIVEEDIVLSGLRVLGQLSISANADDVLFSREIVATIALAMKSHTSSSEIQKTAAGLLTALSAQDSTADYIGEMEGIQNLLSAIRTFSENSDVCAASLSALWNLTVNENNARFATEEGTVTDVLRLMKTHAESSAVLEPACALILSLSMEDENLSSMNKMDCVAELLRVLLNHIRHAKVVKNACMALAALVEPDEEGAYKVLTNGKTGDEEVHGIPIICSAYEAHKDNAEVVENVCTLIMELCEYEEICAEIKHLKIHETVLAEIHKRFKDNQDIMTPCEAALVKIGGGRLQLKFHTGKMACK
ncbi:hypothetical protein CAPTEDRAFT_225008 [Capitella teleta]|uniref:non-specific serine/threonine protein kinase n=1 Tax=Capitella teleta TaxID=283909 RepID=R7V034_CAPTE|nr:hypothetical protein CAPTEDRAFT_225008 [Capitella teleta]|eukprot:ELU12178.1 hypothetical protein CAPTEDRAFT_225008 [Capitella teleta]